MATAEFVHRQRPAGTAFVIGEGGLLKALNDVGYAISSENPDYVIVGEGRVLNFELVERAHRMIARGAKLLSTNSDTWCPTDAGPRPGCGAIVALLESATGEKAYHVGKPNPFMMRAARKRIGLRTDEVTMIGDTMETDIRGATDLGFDSILVLTGSSTRDTLKAYPYTPTRVVESIAELLPPPSNSLVAELAAAFRMRSSADCEKVFRRATIKLNTTNYSRRGRRGLKLSQERCCPAEKQRSRSKLRNSASSVKLIDHTDCTAQTDRAEARRGLVHGGIDAHGLRRDDENSVDLGNYRTGRLVFD
jgi:hypothetical protein